MVMGPGLQYYMFWSFVPLTLSYKATKKNGPSAETVKTEVPCQGLYGSKAEQRRSSLIGNGDQSN